MPLKQKAITIVLLWLTIGFTVRWAITQWWLRCILLGIAVGVTTYLVKLKTYKQQAKPVPSPSEYDS